MTHRVGVCLAPKGAAAVAMLCAFGALISAQVGGAPQSSAAEPGARVPYDLLMTREQVDAMRRAWNERLPYVPGEVLMKFRPGVEVAGRVRALAAVRADVEAGNARW